MISPVFKSAFYLTFSFVWFPLPILFFFLFSSLFPLYSPFTPSCLLSPSLCYVLLIPQNWRLCTFFLSSSLFFYFRLLYPPSYFSTFSLFPKLSAFFLAKPFFSFSLLLYPYMLAFRTTNYLIFTREHALP